MKKVRNGLIKNLHYLCLVGVIALGLITIVGSNGGDGGGGGGGGIMPHITSTPTNVTATAGDEEITISWDSVSGATSYNIYWSTDSGVSKADYEDIIEDITTTSYTHTGLTNGTTYYYVVTADTSSGESVESSEVSATPSAAGTAPSRPTNVSATAGDEKVTISWNSVSGATS